MATIDPKYLLSEADERTCEEWLAPGTSKHGPAWKAIHDVTYRLQKLMDEEGFATAKATGVVPGFQNKYYTYGQAWAALPPPRRVVAVALAMSASIAGEGLGQSSYDNADQLELWIEAASRLAPPTLAARLIPYLQSTDKAVKILERTERWPTPEEMGPQVDFKGLEKEVWDTDWTTPCVQHMLRHKDAFFRGATAE
jgi:hypothetical protein